MELATSPVRVVERGAVASGPSVEEARIIVCAGRGVSGPDGLGITRALAEAIGGVVGATRAVVDSGWIDYGQQIGQTGKRSNPELYIGVGVSGAAAHAVGMRTARTVVAINRDPEAPIGELADLFIVGDLFEIVPRLTAALSGQR